jgi:hypothetical protein
VSSTPGCIVYWQLQRCYISQACSTHPWAEQHLQGCHIIQGLILLINLREV